MEIIAPLPEKLQALWEPHRYKVLYGGRGSAKSWSLARCLVIKAFQTPTRILCCREQQNSIAESVHKLLSDQIAMLGLESYFEIQRDKITCTNGSTFAFEGIRNNARKVKSYEGIDLCWIEEAANLSQESMEVLVPTIRRPGSEIWISFNPELKTDYVYQNYVIRPQPDSFVQFLTWRDNPWFDEVLLREKEALKERDQDAYLNVWEGQCRVLLAGAVYANELRSAMSSDPKRVTAVPYISGTPVDTFWDLGWADHTAIWFRQRIGFEWHYIDYLATNQKNLEYFLKEIQNKPYIYGTHWLPHDAAKVEQGSGMSIMERLRKSVQSVRIVRRTSVTDGIDAARTIFPQCWFDEKKCEAGLESLASYRYEVVDTTTGGLSRQPVHNLYSHGADAFRYSAMAVKQPRTDRAERTQLALASGMRRPLSGRALDPLTGMPSGDILSGGGNSQSNWMGA